MVGNGFFVALFWLVKSNIGEINWKTIVTIVLQGSSLKMTKDFIYDSLFFSLLLQIIAHIIAAAISMEKKKKKNWFVSYYTRIQYY